MINETRFRTSLTGSWSFCVPGGPAEQRLVPGSYSCVGDSIYSKVVRLEIPAAGCRMLLCFEGIAYEGTVLFNGSAVGTMLPYSYYEFDITGWIVSGENTVTVELKDLNAVFGPSEGWKSFSGIVRDVYLLEVPADRLTDVFFTYKLEKDFSAAHCDIPFTVSGVKEGDTVSAELLRGDTVAASGACPACAEALRFDMPAPLLWSPDSPNLYTLRFSLLRGGEILDTRSEQVGFRELAVKDCKFLLNGEDFFFTGVCRHDIWTPETGFTMTDGMIEQDMRMIKQMGANYVRLVHYPHDRRVVEAADRIGLFVSEEPGLWWNDLSDTAVTSRALTVLDKIIRRDRNRPSIAFWLSFNECEFNRQFLLDAVAVARRADPTRMISGANCNDTRQTKEIFDDCGVDFYTLHPYGTHPTHCNGDTLEEACRVLSGKPVIFTEWGGYYVVENPALFTDFCNTMKQLHANNYPEPVLAGMSYWQWQDIAEYQRGEPACFDGVLTEGLVTADRKPKTCYYAFAQFLDKLHRPEWKPEYELTVAGAGSTGKTYLPLALGEPDEKVWKEAVAATAAMPQYHWKKQRRMDRGPALPCPVSAIGALQVDLRAGIPNTVAAKTGSLTVPVHRTASAVWFVGQATLGRGYPIGGERGEEIGSYTLRYADGTEQRIALRNGLETATVCGLIGPTAFEPRAAHTVRAFTLSYDKNWEIYHVGALCVEAKKDAVLETVTVEITNPAYYLPVYGITLEL